MFMTLQEFITRYDLKETDQRDESVPIELSPWEPHEASEVRFYVNVARTIGLGVNEGRQLVRVVYAELGLADSGWVPRGDAFPADDQAIIELMPVEEGDFEELAELRIAAMRESFERVGRFDPERARERLRSSFTPERTRFVVLGGEKVGFLATRDCPEGLQLDHLYIHPGYQNRGIGSAVLEQVLAEAEAQGLAVLVGALKESASNRFYERHGFVLVSEGEWDNYYVRQVKR